MDDVEALIVKLMSSPKDETLITVNAEAVGRGINVQLTPKQSL